jgi:hypothetical protein
MNFFLNELLCRTFTCHKNILVLYGQAARAISTG